jgi:protein-S-isoprenylcysteine O-methyltransferase Ste14
MESNQLPLRQVAVFLSALIYWGGVVINVYRVRKHIGRSPNLMKPKGFKEILLLSGWFFIIAGWIIQPLIIQNHGISALFSFIPFLSRPPGIVLGMLFALSGYSGTLLCYSKLGDSWRLGINNKIKTVLIQQGPYRFVRHPIYLFQIIILLGMIFLLPTPFSLLISIAHYFCIHRMALDEETYLLDTHGEVYQEYFSKTGRFLPKLKGQ